MSKELDQLVSYVEENADGYFLKGSLNNLEELLNQLFSSPEPLDLDSQRKLFIMSMSCFPLFSFMMKPNNVIGNIYIERSKPLSNRK